LNEVARAPLYAVLTSIFTKSSPLYRLFRGGFETASRTELRFRDSYCASPRTRPLNDRSPPEQKVVGSNPIGRTKIKDLRVPVVSRGPKGVQKSRRCCFSVRFNFSDQEASTTAAGYETIRVKVPCVDFFFNPVSQPCSGVTPECFARWNRNSWNTPKWRGPSVEGTSHGMSPS